VPCPEVKTGHVVNEEEDFIAIQQAVDKGRNLWRLSPVRTAQVVGSRLLGLSPNDAYTFVERYREEGSGLLHAVISVQHRECTFIVRLYQPVTQGPKGIWVVASVEEI